MRNINIAMLPGMGPGRGHVRESLMSLFLMLDSYWRGQLIPPLTILNAVFDSGRYDSGMSGGLVWEPFSLSTSEYEELVRFLCTSDSGYQICAPPSSVIYIDDWLTWSADHLGWNTGR